jgi:hypothetical protein
MKPVVPKSRDLSRRSFIAKAEAPGSLQRRFWNVAESGALAEEESSAKAENQVEIDRHKPKQTGTDRKYGDQKPASPPPTMQQLQALAPDMQDIAR